MNKPEIIPMPEPTSLAGRAWIPVVLQNGRRASARPCDISSEIDGQPILRVATGRPDCDTSLTEFLIGLLAVAIGPSCSKEWRRLYDKPPSREELEAAFRPFEDALILDGDGPRFFQDREALESAATPVEAFFIDAPADHFMVAERTKVLSRDGAALALMTLQTSAPSGGAGHRTSLRGGGPLTTLVVPGGKNGGEPTLWERLWANVPLGFAAEPGDAKKVFPWLVPTRTSDIKNGGRKTAPTDVHPGQAFFGMPRRIRLVFEENTERRPCDLLGVVDDVIVVGYMTRPWGTSYEAWGRAHPLSPYYRPKANDPFLPLHLRSSRVGYRQWLGLVMKDQEGLRLPAACVTEFHARARDIADKTVSRDARLLVAGYAMDNMKPLDFGEALLPLLVTSDEKINEWLEEIARDWVKAADVVANQLISAIKRALGGEKSAADRDSTPLDAAKWRFWADTEQPFYGEINKARDAIEPRAGADIADPDNQLKAAHGKRWLGALTRHALRIFDDAVPIESAESDKIEDVIAGRKMLGMALAGYGKAGGPLFTLLGQPAPETKKARKAA